ncbi:MAG: hypothetical protein Q7S62_02255 [bacterium]|nr:hypothetical protein [bacterium]
MIAFLIPIFIVIFITVFSGGGGNILKGVGDSLSHLRPYFFATKASDQKEQKQAPSPSAFQKSQTPAPPSFVLDTVITTGPKEKESIADTRVTFEFSGFVNPLNTQGSISFESKIQGIDSDWVQSSNARILNLPAGPKEYTLFARAKLNTVVDQTPASRTFSINVSPYFQKVTISSLSTTTPSLITLRANLKQGEEISITGWKIRGRAGEFQIPLGIERINPFSSLQAGDSINMRASDTVYLSSSRGPFGLGKHFRPNTCMGYLKSGYAFPLTVPASCSIDKPREEDLLYFLQACQDFIFKKINFSSCEFPDYSKDITVKADTQCTSYLADLATGFTYNSCFIRHADESGFTTNEWHVYMNMNLLTQRFDTIELLDQNGLVVDQEKYSL